jgi:hypothetical protein
MHVIVMKEKSVGTLNDLNVCDHEVTDVKK